ncbi:hypothetical protein CC85DRAFT_44428 [Cutaneotrichosporon oleaginosum]|uniref:Uncharacterized protein n=1 Tax=Cutaneotrichosporon oleaginosum TaxID=879819 RepID=A0A0J0XR49_9TREE|nr:uncharacterized protein CC85DRAFT_44428 [Cutaneotrichosporon oleaginosum]KLT43601.1 hypothetical protein CC85DRAFT_44428 [Cutaneotrichosporon oleaginosum]TXT12731.1 hypothetical protein COLE_03141 [Cutaneotrichosporon oleaginosum]
MLTEPASARSQRHVPILWYPLVPPPVQRSQLSVPPSLSSPIPILTSVISISSRVWLCHIRDLATVAGPRPHPSHAGETLLASRHGGEGEGAGAGAGAGDGLGAAAETCTRTGRNAGCTHAFAKGRGGCGRLSRDSIVVREMEWRWMWRRGGGVEMTSEFSLFRPLISRYGEGSRRRDGRCRRR